MQYDVIVVGGSYAGMSAALPLARARGRVLVIDAGIRRNRFASHAHGLLAQDGADPAVIASVGRDQLQAYPNLEWIEGQANRIEREEGGFSVATGDGRRDRALRVILALGVSDSLPDVPGLAERWGRNVFHCPYCHGYELGGGRVGVLAVGDVSLHQAMLLPEWGPVTFFLDGKLELDAGQSAELAARGVTVEDVPVVRISGEADVELADGRVVSLAGIFTASRTRPVGSLVDDLGCAMEDGPLGPFVRTDGFKETSVPGVFACGDMARGAGSVPLAVGDGAVAGSSVHRSLVFPG